MAYRINCPCCGPVHKAVFGQQDLSDFVVNVMAPHAREDVLLTVFDQQLPPGQKSSLP